MSGESRQDLDEAGGQLTYLEAILFPFVLVAKIVWTVLKWVLEILGWIFSALTEG